MNEQRLQAYFTLIQALLTCPEGQENALLEEHRELLDHGLVTGVSQIDTKQKYLGKYFH